jgi:hypothetical protein
LRTDVRERENLRGWFFSDDKYVLRCGVIADYSAVQGCLFVAQVMLILNPKRLAIRGARHAQAAIT